MSTFLCVLLIAFTLKASAQEKKIEQLFPVVQDNKWGFIDRTGRIVVVPKFDSVEEFHDGLARVTEKGKTVFINTEGVVVLRPNYDVVGDFSEGVAAVNIGEKRAPSIGIIVSPGKWGYIDKTGKLVIPLSFTHAEGFSEGLAAIRDGDRGGFIDHTGKIKFNVSLDATDGFHEGVVAVTYQGGVSYYDRMGKMISTPPLDYGPKSYSSTEGMIAIGTVKKWGFIDDGGKLIIGARFEDAEPFSEGLAAVQVLGELKWCPPDSSGSRAGSPKRYGYIDRTGKMIIAPQFDYAGPFSEGLAPVQTCSQSNFIDRTGKVVITGRFADAFAFSGGLARVDVLENGNLLIGYIDHTGKFVWKPTR